VHEGCGGSTQDAVPEAESRSNEDREEGASVCNGGEKAFRFNERRLARLCAQAVEVASSNHSCRDRHKINKLAFRPEKLLRFCSA
jgi:hypothetical protein